MHTSACIHSQPIIYNCQLHTFSHIYVHTLASAIICIIICMCLSTYLHALHTFAHDTLTYIDIRSRSHTQHTQHTHHTQYTAHTPYTYACRHAGTHTHRHASRLNKYACIHNKYMHTMCVTYTRSQTYIYIYRCICICIRSTCTCAFAFIGMRTYTYVFSAYLDAQLFTRPSGSLCRLGLILKRGWNAGQVAQARLRFQRQREIFMKASEASNRRHVCHHTSLCSFSHRIGVEDGRSSSTQY